MSLSPQAVIRILESRYDHHSARTVFDQIVEKAELNKKGPYDGAAAEKLSSALLEVGARVEGVAARLRDAGGDAKGGSKSSKSTSTKSAAKEEPEAKEEKAAEEEKAADEGKAADDSDDDDTKKTTTRRRSRKSSSGAKK